ncbi:MAG: type IV pilus secretin PilQ [Candidatus Omnitrophica bacterium]|nr:type IV pilus secretin PilQ [Candidatus Omnitrophota bacterium]
MKRRTFFIFMIFLVVAAGAAFAQVPAGQTVAAPTVATASPADSSMPEAAPVAEVSQPGNVTLDFKDADIKNVLKILAFKSGVNIVPSPEVTGMVTIQLNDVPWEEALEIVLRTYGYAYEKKNNIILVMTVDGMKKRREDTIALAEQEAVLTKTFSLNFAKAADVVNSISKMKSEKGSIEVDERTNTLIVTDIGSRLVIIEGVVKKLDRTTPQVLIEGKIVETTLTDTENMGIDWSLEASASGAKRPITFPFQNKSQNQYAPSNFVSNDPKALFSYGTLNATGLSLALEMLQSRAGTEVLSNPRIVTLDNQKAKISVGQQYPIPTYTYNQEQAVMQVSGWSYMDIGVIFEVTPHVNNADMVTLEVEPKITAIDKTATIEGAALPVLNNESAKTIVLVKSGDTLVIAGLITKNKNDTAKNFPVLSKIPILGYIFKKSEKLDIKRDLLVFITPHIITLQMPEQPKVAEGSDKI